MTSPPNHEPADEGRLSRIVEEAIREDVGMGDITTSSIIDDTLTGSAEFLIKEAGVIAGLSVAALVFRFVDEEIDFTPAVTDGARMAAGSVAANAEGPLSGLLVAERTAIIIVNLM